MRILILSLFMIAMSVFASSAAESKANIAVLELESNGISASDAGALTNRLRAELFDTGKFSVVERTQMDAILAEQGFQQTGCTNNSCAVEIGQLLNVEYMVLGSADKVGGLVSINVRMVSVTSGQIVKSIVEDCPTCPIETVLTDVLIRVATKLAQGAATRHDRNINEEPEIPIMPTQHGEDAIANSQTETESHVSSAESSDEVSTSRRKSSASEAQGIKGDFPPKKRVVVTLVAFSVFMVGIITWLVVDSVPH